MIFTIIVLILAALFLLMAMFGMAIRTPDGTGFEKRRGSDWGGRWPWEDESGGYYQTCPICKGLGFKIRPEDIGLGGVDRSKWTWGERGSLLFFNRTYKCDTCAKTGALRGFPLSKKHGLFKFKERPLSGSKSSLLVALALVVISIVGPIVGPWWVGQLRSGDAGPNYYEGLEEYETR